LRPKGASRIRRIREFIRVVGGDRIRVIRAGPDEPIDRLRSITGEMHPQGAWSSDDVFFLPRSSEQLLAYLASYCCAPITIRVPKGSNSSSKSRWARIPVQIPAVPIRFTSAPVERRHLQEARSTLGIFGDYSYAQCQFKFRRAQIPVEIPTGSDSS
jgi:hypothetical protein